MTFHNIIILFPIFLILHIKSRLYTWTLIQIKAGCWSWPNNLIAGLRPVIEGAGRNCINVPPVQGLRQPPIVPAINHSPSTSLVNILSCFQRGGIGAVEPEVIKYQLVKRNQPATIWYNQSANIGEYDVGMEGKLLKSDKNEMYKMV